MIDKENRDESKMAINGSRCIHFISTESQFAQVARDTSIRNGEIVPKNNKRWRDITIKNLEVVLKANKRWRL